MSEQKSVQWFADRSARFTGSAVHKLMASGKGEMFGETAKKYILEKVAEIITGGLSQENESVDVYATRWGNEYEPHARRCYEEFTFNQVQETGFAKYGEYFGASPDGLIGEDGVLEIKCPYLSKVHVQYLLCENAQDLMKIAPQYIYQMQSEMIATGRKWADFVSYDPRCDERYCLKVIRIDRDPAMCAEILTRVNAAAKIMQEMLNKLTK